MPQARANDVKLYYVEAGNGDPVIFVHEFAGDYRSWEPQLRHFSRRYRCVAFNARGYPPSQVPSEAEQYSPQIAAADLIGLLDFLGLRRVHLVGLAMGAGTVLEVGLQHPQRVRSLVLAAAGHGVLSADQADFRQQAQVIAERIDAEGIASVTTDYAVRSERLPFKNKDPRGWQEFATALAHHSSEGTKLTLAGIQMRRPALDTELARDALATLRVPTLIMSGDDDLSGLAGSLYLRATLPAAGLCILPRTGRSINLEEPLLFNTAVQDFITTVDAKRWRLN